MGLDMNVYATNGEDLTKEDLYGEGDFWGDLKSWYWRKANAVHIWMVENVQDGKDDCGLYEIFPNQLIKLREIVDKVLTNPKKADDLLPTASGFFFGSTDYDDWYMEDLQLTFKHLTEMLEENESTPTRFFYNASW